MSRKVKHNPSINKQAFKASQGCCRICGDCNKAVLDVHRIVPGSEGGKYQKFNSTCICCKCHRRVHDGQIVIHRYYLASSGAYLLHITEDGIDKFI